MLDFAENAALSRLTGGDLQAFARMVDASPSILWVADAEGRCVYLSQQWYVATGGTPELDLGHGWTRHIHPDDRTSALAVYEEAAQLKNSFRVELRFRHRDGSYRWYLDAGNPRFNEAGAFCGFIGSVVDVHETKSISEAHREQREIVRSMTEQNLVGIVRTDLNGRFVFANEEFCRFVGRPLAELQRLTVADVTHPEDYRASGPMLENLVRTGESFLLEKRYVRPDKSLFWVQNVVTLVRDSSGAPESILAIASDMNERRRQQVQLQEREAYFQSLVDNSPAMIWITDQEAHCTYLSKSWYDYTGRSPEQDLGFGWLENIHPADYPAASAMYSKATAARGFLSIDYRLRRHDGTYRWAVDIGHPRFDAEGNFVGYIGTVIDVHDQKLAAEQLAESQQELEALTRFIPQIIWTALPDGKTDFFNERWYEFTGMDRSLSGDALWLPIIHPEDQQRTFEAWYHSVKTGEPYSIEYRFWDRHHQDYRWFLGQAVPLKDSQGHIRRWYGSCVDIHAQKTLSEELRKTVLARDEFLSIASHELRTPLTSLKLQAQTLDRAFAQGQEEYYSRERIVNFARQTSRQVNRLSRLVDDMLDVSRIRTGLLTMEKRDFDLGDLVAEVAGRLRDQFTTEQGSVAVQLEREPAPGHWDYLRIEQVVTNLLTNAFRYGRRRPVRVRVTSDSERRVVRLSVQDEGDGIAPEYLEKIFDPFERAGMSANEVSGMGLGLFISRQIVTAHGGKIWAESLVGAGATFVMELPVSASS